LTDEASVGPKAAAVIRAIDAYNAGDLGGLLTIAHPDIEWEGENPDEALRALEGDPTDA
jgi:hypothetical protein